MNNVFQHAGVDAFIPVEEQAQGNRKCIFAFIPVDQQAQGNRKFIFYIRY